MKVERRDVERGTKKMERVKGRIGIEAWPEKIRMGWISVLAAVVVG